MKIYKNKFRTLFLLKNLFKYLSRKRKLELLLSFLIMGISGCLELFVLGIAYPFIDSISNTEVNKIDILFYSFSIDSKLIGLLTFAFVITIFLSMALRLLNIKYNYLIAAKLGSELATKSFSSILNLEYNSIINLNSNYLLSTITTQVEKTYWAITFLLQGFSSLFTLIFISAYLSFLNPITFITLILLFLLIYYSFSKKDKKRVLSNSNFLENAQKKEAKFIKESLDSIRSIILTNFQFETSNKFNKIDIPMRLKESENVVLSIAPKLWVESIFLAVLILIAFIISTLNSNNYSTLAILGTFAIALQRLIPNLQKIYESINGIRSRSGSIIAVLKILELNKKSIFLEKYPKTKLNFNLKIECQNLSFKYEKSNNLILENINLTINKGSTIGIIGETGSGKSTLINIILGLIKPTKGEVLVDGVNIFQDSNTIKKWRNSVAEVPQEVYLVDDTIKNNILLNKKNHKDIQQKFNEACEAASIINFVNSLHKKFETSVGDSGIYLSGGQKQRIGIARAILNNPGLLILDEATSALDNQTEQKVINNLKRFLPNTTKIMIAHNLSSLKNCDKIIEVKDNKLNELTKIQFLELINK